MRGVLRSCYFRQERTFYNAYPGCAALLHSISSHKAAHVTGAVGRVFPGSAAESPPPPIAPPPSHYAPPAAKMVLSDAVVDAIGGSIGSMLGVGLTQPLSTLCTLQSLSPEEGAVATQQPREDRLWHSLVRHLPEPVRALYLQAVRCGVGSLWGGLEINIFSIAGDDNSPLLIKLHMATGMKPAAMHPSIYSASAAWAVAACCRAHPQQRTRPPPPADSSAVMLLCCAAVQCRERPTSTPTPGECTATPWPTPCMSQTTKPTLPACLRHCPPPHTRSLRHAVVNALRARRGLPPLADADSRREDLGLLGSILVPALAGAANVLLTQVRGLPFVGC